jgi:glycosyltransferase involved in cell wall biosynthesis
MLKSLRNLLRKRSDYAYYTNLSNKLPRNLPKISFFTAMKNRLEHIKVTLPANIESAQSYGNFQWILLNYGCTDPQTEEWVQTVVRPLTKSGLVDYYHYKDAKHFRFAHARNIGLACADGELACNVDADNFIGDGFAQYLAARTQRPKTFVRMSGIKRGSKGRICARTQDLHQIGGYDENFESWGADDGDLAERLRRSGIRQITCYIEEFGNVIEHNDTLRIAETEKDFAESRRLSEKNRSRNRERETIKITNPKAQIKLEKNFSENVILELNA